MKQEYSRFMKMTNSIYLKNPKKGLFLYNILRFTQSHNKS